MSTKHFSHGFKVIVKSNIRHSDIKTNAFGGLNLIYPKMIKSGFLDVVDSVLGKRVKQAKFSYSQILSSHILGIFSGNKRIYHAGKHKRNLDNISGVEIPSPYTTSRIFRDLSVPNDHVPFDGKSGDHLINNNDRMNSLLALSGISLGLIDPKADNVLDYDNTVVGNRKYDSTRTYKRMERDFVYGYQPALASVSGTPFFIEGRSGHTGAQSFIDKTTIRCVEQAKEHGVKISKFRADSASYNAKLMSYLNKEEIEFFISQRKHKNLVDRIRWEVDDWVEGFWKGVPCSFGSTEHTVTETKETYRVVIKRMDNNGYNYSCIITNNDDMSNEEVLKFYAMRGAEEKRFAELKNEFNFALCPFSLLEENTVFWIINSIAYNVYKYLLAIFQKGISSLKKNSWLRVFKEIVIFHVVIMYSNGTVDVSNADEQTRKLFRKFWEDF
ncbi:MAG: transposase [Crocinitomicaceae bacterium]|nr:transposase [Crocinitomicaceae bacterium]